MFSERNTNFHQIILDKIDELKSGVANGTVIPLLTWDLDEHFDSWLSPIYLSVLTINGSVSLIMHFLIFWLIIKKTPKEMKDYRYFLINIAVMSFVHDIQLTIYWRPVPFFPISAAFVQGPSYHLGDFGGHLGMVSIIVLVTLYMCSMICGFIYRLVSLMDTVYYRIMMSWKGLMMAIVIHLFPAIVLGGMIHFSYVPSEIIKEKILLRFPQLSPIIENEAIFGYDAQYNPMIVYFFLVVLIFIFIFVPIIEFGCIFAILYKLREMKNIMTKKTYKLHKNLLFALTVQILLPQIMILIPDVFVVFGAWKEWPHVNIITEATLMSCTFHSVIDNFVMLFVITPYRKAFIKLLTSIRLGKYKISISISTKPTTIANATQNSQTASRRNTTNISLY